MDTKKFIHGKNLEIEKVTIVFEETRQRLLDELRAGEHARDELINKLSAERDEAALKEKLKGFPTELVENHKTCAVCGELMRPFQYMEGETIVKAWACRVGSLQENHDLIRIS